MKIYFLAIFFVFGVNLKAQTSLVKNAFSYKFVATDYLTLDKIYQKANNYSRILNPDDWNYAIELGYFRHINKHLSVGIPLRLGSIDAQHLVYDGGDSLCQPCDRREQLEFFVGADITAIYKLNNDWLLKEDFFLAPYFLLGIGGRYLTERQEHFDFQLPMGLGLNIRLNQNFYIQMQMEYRKSLIAKKDGFEITGGLFWLINFKKNKKNEN